MAKPTGATDMSSYRTKRMASKRERRELSREERELLREALLNSSTHEYDIEPEQR